MFHEKSNADIVIYPYGMDSANDDYVNLANDLCFTQKAKLTKGNIGKVTRELQADMGLFVVLLSCLSRNGFDFADLEEIITLLKEYDTKVVGNEQGFYSRKGATFNYLYWYSAIARLMAYDLRKRLTGSSIVLAKIKKLAAMQLKNEEFSLVHYLYAMKDPKIRKEYTEIVQSFILGLDGDITTDTFSLDEIVLPPAEEIEEDEGADAED